MFSLQQENCDFGEQEVPSTHRFLLVRVREQDHYLPSESQSLFQLLLKRWAGQSLAKSKVCQKGNKRALLPCVGGWGCHFLEWEFQIG